MLSVQTRSKMGDYKCALSDDALKYAIQHLKEDDDSRKLQIARMQAWVQSQSSIDSAQDAVTVVRFLRCCKFDEEETKKRFIQYFQARSNTPEWFQNRDPDLPQLQELLHLGIFLPLRQRDSEGRLVVIIRAAVHDPSRYLQSDVFKLSNMMFDIAIEEDENVSVFGYVAVVDLSGISLGHTIQLAPTVIGKAVSYWEECSPVHLQRMDYIHAPMHVNLVLDIFRRFMSENLKSRIQVHGSKLSSLHALISPSILPQEYGGSDGTIQDITDSWKIKLGEKRAWLLEEESTNF